MPNIEVQVADAAWQSEPDDPESITRRVVGALLQELGLETLPGALSLRFAGDAEVRALNAQYRQKDKPTNVLSFPAPDHPGAAEKALGDLIFARETVAGEAAAQGKTLAAHTSHLIAHGILHLLGHDHQNDIEAEKMESLERAILARLDIDDPYRDDIVMGVAHGA